MKIVGIICEYNPFHLGHAKQIRKIKEIMGDDTAIVCLMSGNFVQRGMPAIFDKSLRTAAAIEAGADLVLELPVTKCLSSAEGFAAGGVQILGKFCDYLCFGSETGNEETLMATAKALLSDDFPAKLKLELEKGCSFPAARQAALGELGKLLENPNDILAVEYCKAIINEKCNMKPLVIRREGSYHDVVADHENPSATAIRQLIGKGEDFSHFVPDTSLYDGATIHDITFGEQAILYRLRTMSDDEFQALPYGTEGLWNKFMDACRKCSRLEQIIAATKSKRYTRSRIDRMVMCATLGISQEILERSIPYCRILGLNDQGRVVLNMAREHGSFPNIGTKMEDSYQQLERRCDDIYALFAAQAGAAGQADKRRIVYYGKNGKKEISGC